MDRTSRPVSCLARALGLAALLLSIAVVAGCASRACGPCAKPPPPPPAPCAQPCPAPCPEPCGTQTNGADAEFYRQFFSGPGRLPCPDCRNDVDAVNSFIKGELCCPRRPIPPAPCCPNPDPCACRQK